MVLGLKSLPVNEYMVYSIKGDGACFFSSCAAHIYKDETHVDTLRILTHHFIIDQWWYFADFFPFPFVGTVGTGEKSYNVCIEEVTELHSFLLSNDSLKLWSDSQVTQIWTYISHPYTCICIYRFDYCLCVTLFC